MSRRNLNTSQIARAREQGNGALISDLNNIDLKTGFYWVASGANGAPAGVSSNAAGLIHMRYNQQALFQMFFNYSVGYVYIRRYVTDAWQNWQRVTMT